MAVQHLECGLIEVKLVDAVAGQMVFSGYGSVFGNVDSYGDVIQKGAFKKTLSEAKRSGQWPAMLSQHGAWGMTSEDLTPVGIWTDMEEDDTGLRLEGKFAETQRGRELYTLMKMDPRPAISGLSIGYIAKEFTVGTKPDEPRRLLKRVELVEVSLVTFPGNLKARVQSVKDGLSIRDVEKALRDVGFSQSEAKAILAEGYKSIAQRDVDQGIEKLANQIRQNIATLTA